MFSLLPAQAFEQDAAAMLTDGDAAFLRVNNRKPAHALQAGECAGATNLRSENGKMVPRYGVAIDGWGFGNPNMAHGLTMEPVDELHVQVDIDGFIVGKTYTYVSGGADGEFIIAGTGSTRIYGPATFVAEDTTYQLSANSTTAIETSAVIKLVRANTRAYKHFSDRITNTLNGILVTDDWRDDSGEDGGRGRVFRILPGNVPQEIPLNGHDVWDTARLVQCDNAMLLLRHGNQRYYFSASAVNAADYIQLNVTPPWALNTGRRVRFELATAGSAIYGASPPAAGNYYYAKHIANDRIEFYTDSGLTSILNMATGGVDDPVGKFYIEEAIDPVPFFGNGARNLIMQPNESGNNAFEVGFLDVPDNAEVSAVAANVLTVENHRFQPGDSVSGNANELKESTGPDVYIAWPKYAAPQSDHSIRLYSSAVNAQIDNGTTGLQTVLAGQSGISLWKTSAARVPMPPCREGAFVNGRFIGINGQDRVVISDAFDFLHFTVFAGTVPANQGEAGNANWILPFGDGVVAVGKDLNVIGIAGLSGAPSGWSERNITTEYNGIAALSALQIGTDVWFASRKGFASAIRTVAGETLGTSRTVSRDIPTDLADIDWLNARIMCAETWNNRLFWAVPTRGQDQSSVVNNKVLVLNRNNDTLRVQQQVLGNEIIGGIVDTGAPIDSWEGSWTGDLLTPYAFAKLSVNGEERLTFATPDGLVCWLHDGWDDVGEVIETELLPRAYFGGAEVKANAGLIKWESFQPKISAYIRTAGYNEEEQLAGFDELEYDRTQYLVDGQADYVPASSTTETYDVAHRSDYSPSADELLVARTDVHQALTEPFRCLLRDHSPQLRIVNEQGSLRICAITMHASPAAVNATRKT